MVFELSLSGDFSLSMCFFNQDLMGVCLVGVGLLVGESSITTSLSWSWDASTSLQLMRMSMKKLKYWLKAKHAQETATLCCTCFAIVPSV